jgi:hypothetical protein
MRANTQTRANAESGLTPHARAPPQVGPTEYHLFLHPDTGTRASTEWYRPNPEAGPNLPRPRRSAPAGRAPAPGS